MEEGLVAVDRGSFQPVIERPESIELLLPAGARAVLLEVSRTKVKRATLRSVIMLLIRITPVSGL
jgi:gamma-glutamylcysteine synthetase